MIYADNAATTKLCKEAYDAMRLYLLEEYGNASQPYFFAKPAKKAAESGRRLSRYEQSLLDAKEGRGAFI